MKDMTPGQRRSVVTSVAEIWSQLLSLRFEAIGSLRTGSMPNECIDVGPLVHIVRTREGDVSAPLQEKCGPFTSQR